MNHDEVGHKIPVDRTLDEARPEEYDALLLPGGIANPDRLRMNEAAVRFNRAIYDQRKPIAAICHGPWTLIEADIVRGRTVTSWPSLKTDLKNAGANWVDREVVIDGGLVTSRKPDDIPAFNKAIIAAPGLTELGPKELSGGIFAGCGESCGACDSDCSSSRTRSRSRSRSSTSSA